VRWTTTAGALTGGDAAGTWWQLTADRTFTISYTGLTGGSSVTGTLALATDGAGANIIASGVYDLSPGVQEF
jgi:hypothetical protein